MKKIKRIIISCLIMTFAFVSVGKIQMIKADTEDTVSVTFNTKDKVEVMNIQRGTSLSKIVDPTATGYTFVQWIKSSTLDSEDAMAMKALDHLINSQVVKTYLAKSNNRNLDSTASFKGNVASTIKVDLDTYLGISTSSWKINKTNGKINFYWTATDITNLVEGTQVDKIYHYSTTTGYEIMEGIVKIYNYNDSGVVAKYNILDGYANAKSFTYIALPSTPDTTSIINYDVTYTAQYTLNTYQIAYELDGGENNVNNVSSYDVENTSTFENPTKDGYVFDGWYLKSNFETTITNTENLSGDITLYAKWSKHVDPTPVDPTPVDPTPVEPTPVAQTPIAPLNDALVIPNTTNTQEVVEEESTPLAALDEKTNDETVLAQNTPQARLSETSSNSFPWWIIVVILGVSFGIYEYRKHNTKTE